MIFNLVPFYGAGRAANSGEVNARANDARYSVSLMSGTCLLAGACAWPILQCGLLVGEISGNAVAWSAGPITTIREVPALRESMRCKGSVSELIRRIAALQNLVTIERARSRGLDP